MGEGIQCVGGGQPIFDHNTPQNLQKSPKKSQKNPNQPVFDHDRIRPYYAGVGGGRIDPIEAVSGGKPSRLWVRGQFMQKCSQSTLLAEGFMENMAIPFSYAQS